MKAMRNVFYIVNEQKKERRAKEEHERSARFLQSRQGSGRTVSKGERMEEVGTGRGQGRRLGSGEDT